MLARYGRPVTRFFSSCSSSSSSSTTTTTTTTTKPSFQDFMKQAGKDKKHENLTPTKFPNSNASSKLNVYIETYGCQMNVSDSEVVMSILNSAGHNKVESIDTADVVLLNTCAIRENAEKKVWDRLVALRKVKEKQKHAVVGVLGCMAERLKDKLLESERVVDLVVGPDAYRDLPHLLDVLHQKEDRNNDVDDNIDYRSKGLVNVQLSLEETYADIAPVRGSTEPGGSAYVSIMRGCNNMCSFCIVPFTRGRERSRPVASIEDEVKRLRDEGVKQVVLLGQNVNSYHDRSTPTMFSEEIAKETTKLSNPGFSTIYKRSNDESSVRFAELVHRVAIVDPNIRIRFTSPHPKDFPDILLSVMKDHPNVCKCVHLPAQSGSSAVLQNMRRGYTRESYMDVANHIRSRLPGVALTSDIICGFCGETEEDHLQTVSLMETVKFEMAYMFAYSMREKTHAHRTMKDDVPEDVKSRRLTEVISTFLRCAAENNLQETGKMHLVLIEKRSHRNANDWVGKTDTNKVLIFPEQTVAASLTDNTPVQVAAGDYVLAKVLSSTSATLKGTAIARCSIPEWHNRFNNN